GLELAVLESVAALPAGRVVSDHEKDSGSPSGSEDPAPESVTVSVTKTMVRSCPASATGGELPVVIVTESGALTAVPSCTTSCTTYEPGRSTTNVGSSAEGSEKAARLPAGRDTNAQV